MLTGVGSQFSRRPSFYPNPSSGVFLNDIELDHAIQVFDTMGRLILVKQASSEMSLDLSEFPNGIYIAKVAGGGNELIHRLVKR